MAKRKTYRITFATRAEAGLFLYELHAWGVRESRYTMNEVDKRYFFTTQDANVIDICAESFQTRRYTIEVNPPTRAKRSDGVVIIQDRTVNNETRQ